MAKYKETGIEDLKEALSIEGISDGRTKQMRKLKQLQRALREDFDAALSEILTTQISLNLVAEKEITDKSLKKGKMALSQELKALRKDTMDKLKLLEKIKKNKQISSSENELAKLILGGADE